MQTGNEQATCKSAYLMDMKARVQNLGHWKTPDSEPALIPLFVNRNPPAAAAALNNGVMPTGGEQARNPKPAQSIRLSSNLISTSAVWSSITSSRACHGVDRAPLAGDQNGRDGETRREARRSAVRGPRIFGNCFAQLTLYNSLPLPEHSQAAMSSSEHPRAALPPSAGLFLRCLSIFRQPSS